VLGLLDDRSYSSSNSIINNFIATSSNLQNEILDIKEDLYDVKIAISCIDLDRIVQGSINKYIVDNIYNDSLVINGTLTVRNIQIIDFDDDYYSLGYRYIEGERKINNLDKVFDLMIEFYKNIPAKTICFSQGGDHIGGFSGIKLKRKAMNSFLCSTDRPFQFVGSINEDVNTYTTLGSRGELFLTFTNINLSQGDTQSNSGGMTDEYALSGTYVKSFHSVMMHPSGVKISMMNSKNPRLHHSIKWINTTPMIINEKHKKNKKK
jgi:hypothetical protein